MLRSLPKIIFSRKILILLTLIKRINHFSTLHDFKMEGESHKQTKIDSIDFYANYHGHKVHQLHLVHSALKQIGKKNIIYLCGDSTMDNKHWLYPGSKYGYQAL